MQGIRLGEILVRQGVLTPEEVDHIVKVQANVGRPFGDLAERIYGVDPKSIELAWTRQYRLTVGTIDPETLAVDPACTRLINRRQAWQFFVAPVQRDGSDLMLLTDEQHLVKALNFAAATFAEPVSFLIADAASLRQFLMQHYPVPDFMVEMAESLRR